MNKELEALKTLDYHNDLKKYWGKEFDVVEQALLELDDIKNAKHSEALKCFENMQYRIASNISTIEHTIIKQALIKAQEQDKILNAIKGKVIWVENDKLMCGRYADTEIELEEEDFENKEEFELVKEMIK